MQRVDSVAWDTVGRPARMFEAADEHLGACGERRGVVSVMFYAAQLSAPYGEAHGSGGRDQRTQVRRRSVEHRLKQTRLRQGQHHTPHGHLNGRTDLQQLDPNCFRLIGKILEHACRLLRRLELRLGRVPLHSHDAQQTGVFRQAKEEINVMILAPTHQRFAAETAVATHHDVHVRPMLPHIRDDALQMLEQPDRLVKVGRPQQGKSG